jgi:hypothetical protein
MTLDEVQKLVEASLPPIIQEGKEGILIGLLLEARIDLDRPLVKTFSPDKVARALLGRGATRDPTCAQPLTAALDRDEGECVLTDGGDPSGGTPNAPGPFSSLTYSKNMQLGNITFFKRPKFTEITSDLPSVKLLPAVAYDAALRFAMNTLGMSPLEIPDARQLGAPLRLSGGPRPSSSCGLSLSSARSNCRGRSRTRLRGPSSSSRTCSRRVKPPSWWTTKGYRALVSRTGCRFRST